MTDTWYPYNRKNRSRYFELNDQTLTPIISQGNDGFRNHEHFFKKVSFKAINRDSYNSYQHRSWNNKSRLVSAQSISEFSHKNGHSRFILSNQIDYYYLFNTGDDLILKNYSNGNHRNFKQPLWTLKESTTGWYSILILYVKDTDEVLKIIQTSIAPLVFYPYNKHFLHGTLKFLVDDFKVAKRLQNTNLKITLRDDRKLTIKVSAYLPTRRVISLTPVSNEVREKMIEVIATRYNPNSKSLNLSHFHACPLFTENQLFAPLNQPAVLLVALNMVSHYTKCNLYELSLENNHIYLSEGLVWIRRLFPKLTVLDLGGNKLSNFKDLRCFLGFTIEELNLSNNPVCDMNDNENYRRHVLTIFPMLKKLDNSELPSRYSAICVGSKLKIPVYLGNSYPTPEGHDPDQLNPITSLVESFLTQYYERYDNKVSKEIIAEAYHPNATFSLSSCFISNYSKGSLDEYLLESRNLLKSNWKRIQRNCLIHKGNENITNFLKQLPNTKHDLGSFIVDVPLFNAAMIQIVVNGVFAETNHRLHVLRSFCRTFIIVPVGSGWSILSDMLFVTVTSDELNLETSKRLHKFKPNRVPMNDDHLNDNNNKSTLMKDLEMRNIMEVVTSVDQQPSTSNYLQPSHQQITSSSSVSSTERSLISLSSNKLIMIKHFSNESGMNEKWAEKCLEDNNWDYAKSARCFSILKRNIPQEAFTN